MVTNVQVITLTANDYADLIFSAFLFYPALRIVEYFVCGIFSYFGWILRRRFSRIFLRRLREVRARNLVKCDLVNPKW